MTTKNVVAVDLGAESGRVMAVQFDGKGLHLHEAHRFPNVAVKSRGTLQWDILRLWSDIQAGIEKSKAYNPASLGVDTWAVDFGLLDAQGTLIGNVVQYRDSRTDGMMDNVFSRVPRAEVFAQTGIQFLPFNTIYQLMSMVEAQSPALQIADTFLTVPDLLNYWLTGTKVCEFTNATTSQLYNPRTGAWATGLMDALGIPKDIFPDIVMPGTRLGAYEGIPVIAPATHDTGSAVAGVPTTTKNYAYISSGTWSLVGMEVAEPVINEAALAANIKNEGGVNNTFRLLKNVMGLWIVQQCRAMWERLEYYYTYEQLQQEAVAATPFRSLIDIDDPRFLPPGDHIDLIDTICHERAMPKPNSVGAYIRCVLESFTMSYRRVIENLEQLSGQSIEVIHVVGGGSQNRLLNQMTANATGKRVVAGPVEATVIGNALVQLIALGELSNLEEARQLVAGMDGLTTYEPQDTAAWDEAYGRWNDMLNIASWRL